jgi:hypothetical protein
MRRGLIVVVAMVLAGCASDRYEVVRPPERAADVYPHAHAHHAVAVAAEAIARERRSRLYFGAPLAEQGVLPVRVLVTNHGDQPVRVDPKDVLLARRGAALDPLPVELVARAVERARGDVAAETAREIRAYLGEVVLKAGAVAPGQTGGGVLFFQVADDGEGGYNRLSVLDVYGAEALELTMQVTTGESGERLRFGPFYLGD